MCANLEFNCFSSSAFLRFYFLNVPYVLKNVGTESLLLGFQSALWNVNVSYSRTQHYATSGDRTEGPLHTECDALSERHCAPRFIMLERFVPVSPSSAPECFPACHACPWWRYGSILVRHDSSWLTVDNPGQLEHGLSIEH